MPKQGTTKQMHFPRVHMCCIPGVDKSVAVGEPAAAAANVCDASFSSAQIQKTLFMDACTQYHSQGDKQKQKSISAFSRRSILP
jgi:hypothetical protein